MGHGMCSSLSPRITQDAHNKFVAQLDIGRDTKKLNARIYSKTVKASRCGDTKTCNDRNGIDKDNYNIRSNSVVELNSSSTGGLKLLASSLNSGSHSLPSSVYIPNTTSPRDWGSFVGS